MTPATYGQVIFIFLVSICMSCVVSAVSVFYTAGFVDAFFGLCITAWLKSWIVVFPSLLIIAPLVRRFADKLLIN